uniref:Uncharacterized protein n=1 Tax=Panagrolaimus sp. ES5 TaxID=591445 RepID=A0AC34G3Z3_9BILA
MSLQLLQKSLNLDNESDGIVEKSTSRKARKSKVAEERELVRNLDQRFQYNIDSGILEKSKRDEVHKMKGDLTYMFSQKDAKNGYSLVEQFRDTRPPDIAAHNRKYMKYSQKYKIPEEAAKSCVLSSIKKDKMKKKRLAERFDLRGIYCLLNSNIIVLN